MREREIGNSHTQKERKRKKNLKESLTVRDPNRFVDPAHKLWFSAHFFVLRSLAVFQCTIADKKFNGKLEPQRHINNRFKYTFEHFRIII